MGTDAGPALSVPRADEAPLDALRREVEEALAAFLERSLRAAPSGVAEPIRHAVLAPGKRMRPLLLLAGYRSAGGTHPAAATLACSVELVHAYSLIHDDLPCMDDDLLRRGRPTVHVRFGVRPAVLAGAILMPLAVRAICEATEEIGLGPVRRQRLVRTLTIAAGASGMVGGQLRDLRAEGRRIEWEELEEIHLGKTAELMACAVVMGGVAAEVAEETVSRLRRFGTALGLAFQVVDDILDMTGDLHEMGKVGGRDVALGKATTPSVVGMEGAERLGRELADRARSELEALGRPPLLAALVERAVERRR